MNKNKLTLIALFVGATLGTTVLTGCQSTNSLASTSNSVVKSQNDKRDYRYLELDNGLKVILVSDENADKSAASMDVHIGHMADPKDREGLTHFLEHMLFLGTEKYPTVGEFQEFIKANGGFYNAGTGQQHTNYFFEVNQASFNEALDRFSEFFISPTFNPTFVDREKNAVHSEYSLKIKDEGRRYREVLKDTSNQAHPVSQFSVGNLTTLADREDSKLIDDLRAHYKKYYSASIMTLSIVGKEDLDTLESWAKSKFSAVPNNGIAVNKPKVAPFTEDQLGVQINIDALRDTRSLTLQFPIPSTTKHFKTKPVSLLTRLLGHEGTGSLYSYLKNKGFVESLSAYNYGPNDHEMLYIHFELTKKGLAQRDEVAEAAFAYIELIKEQGVSKQYFEEQQKIANIEFNFAEKHNAAMTASFITSQLQNYAPEYVLNSPYTYEQWDPELVSEYLAYLTPQNLRSVLVAKGLETDTIQPEYDTKYGIKALTTQQLARYAAPKTISELKLPEANPFIATELAVKPQSQASSIPQVVFEKPGFKFWHKQDSEFLIPKADVVVNIYSDFAANSAESRAKNDLYAALLEDSLNEYGYLAKQAGLDYDINATSQGIEFTVGGYDQKQGLLLATINKRIKSLTIDPASFELHKNRLIRDWQNAKHARPYTQAIGAMQAIWKESTFAPAALANALQTVTMEDLAAYIKAFHKEIDVEVLGHGNITTTDASALAKQLHAINFADASPKSRAKQAVLVNKTGQPLIKQLNIDHNDSSFVMSLVSDDTSIENSAKYALLGTLIDAPFGQNIRTEKQLGYVVGTSQHFVNGLPTLLFIIQSHAAGPVELQGHVNAFLEGFESTIANMPEAEFQKYKMAVINDLTAKDKNLSERTQSYSHNIELGYAQFDRNAQLANAVDALTLDDIKGAYKEVVLNGSPIITRSFGQAHRNTEDFKNALTDSSLCKKDACFSNQLTRAVRL
ncbi:insulinase family protein [Pseudoalteromonas sp. T1lg65]|uniref:insulinase family protein n=1 Tax=Pseudoalteromonas sp. T1lg65 TaxID=2077101 RepID=UPI003F7ABC49